jgi:hypothetical protein
VPRSRRVVVIVAIVFVVAGLLVWVDRSTERAPGAAAATIARRLRQTESAPRDIEAYTKLATWVDGFDFGPAYQRNHGAPPITPRAVDDMAANGVTTLFLQAARNDPRSPGGVVDRARVGEFLIRAHRRGMRVVGWYLPTFVDVAADVANLRQIVDFDVLGHRFDGVAVDIEDVDDLRDVADRNQRLIEESKQLRAVSGTNTIGAVVLPPVLTEVVNPSYWPDFPWPELRSLYDVWLPMSYWTFRTAASGYHDGYAYSDESIRRLRNDLGDQNAVVHAIGGVGDKLTIPEIQRFVESLPAGRAVGGSIYDWGSMTPADRAALAAGFSTGQAANLPQPP